MLSGEAMPGFVDPELIRKAQGAYSYKEELPPVDGWFVGF